MFTDARTMLEVTIKTPLSRPDLAIFLAGSFCIRLKAETTQQHFGYGPFGADNPRRKMGDFFVDSPVGNNPFRDVN